MAIQEQIFCNFIRSQPVSVFQVFNFRIVETKSIFLKYRN